MTTKTTTTTTFDPVEFAIFRDYQLMKRSTTDTAAPVAPKPRGKPGPKPKNQQPHPSSSTTNGTKTTKRAAESMSATTTSTTTNKKQRTKKEEPKTKTKSKDKTKDKSAPSEEEMKTLLETLQKELGHITAPMVFTHFPRTGLSVEELTPSKDVDMFKVNCDIAASAAATPESVTGFFESPISSFLVSESISNARRAELAAKFILRRTDILDVLDDEERAKFLAVKSLTSFEGVSSQDIVDTFGAVEMIHRFPLADFEAFLQNHGVPSLAQRWERGGEMGVEIEKRFENRITVVVRAARKSYIVAYIKGLKTRVVKTLTKINSSMIIHELKVADSKTFGNPTGVDGVYKNDVVAIVKPRNMARARRLQAGTDDATILMAESMAQVAAAIFAQNLTPVGIKFKATDLLPTDDDVDGIENEDNDVDDGDVDTDPMTTPRRPTTTTTTTTKIKAPDAPKKPVARPRKPMTTSVDASTSEITALRTAWMTSSKELDAAAASSTSTSGENGIAALSSSSSSSSSSDEDDAGDNDDVVGDVGDDAGDAGDDNDGDGDDDDDVAWKVPEGVA